MTYLTAFSSHLEAQDRSNNTIEAYTRDIALYATWFEEQNHQAFQPSFLCAPDLREYRRYLFEEQQLDGDSWNRKRASFKAFAVFCAQQGWIHGDPLIGVNRVPPKEQPPKALTHNEWLAVRRLLDHHVNSPRTERKRNDAIRDRAMLSLGYYCLLRSSEVVKLDVSDLLLKEKSGEIRIRQAKGRKDATVKTGLEVRTALNAWLSVHPGTISLFPSERSDRISQRRVEEIANQIGVEACIPDLWFHRFRHTAISHGLNEMEIPLPIMQGLARHKDGRTTMRYAKATDQQLADAAERL